MNTNVVLWLITNWKGNKNFKNQPPINVVFHMGAIRLSHLIFLYVNRHMSPNCIAITNIRVSLLSLITFPLITPSKFRLSSQIWLPKQHQHVSFLQSKRQSFTPS
jgi:hypothetical protein